MLIEFKKSNVQNENKYDPLQYVSSGFYYDELDVILVNKDVNTVIYICPTNDLRLITNGQELNEVK